METQTIKEFRNSNFHGTDLPIYEVTYKHGKGYITEIRIYHHLQKISVATNAPLTLLMLSRLTNTLKEMQKQFAAGKLSKKIPVDITEYVTHFSSC